MHQAAVVPIARFTLARDVSIEPGPLRVVLRVPNVDGSQPPSTISIEIGPGMSVTAANDPSQVTVTWEGARPPGIETLLAKLGPPTSGACWMQCSWNDRVILTEHQTRVRSSTTLVLR